MLIRFTFENFFSFNTQNEFSMVKGLTHSHRNHIIEKTNRSDVSILKGAAIYGSNASGKSAFVKAIHFAKKLVLSGTKPDKRIFIDQFKLTLEQNRPSLFQFEIKLGKVIFTYGFMLTQNEITKEWLYSQEKGVRQELFNRKTVKGSTKIEFNKKQVVNEEEQQFLNFVAKGTRPNQLFLTESIERNLKQYKNIYDWFANKLTIIFPHSIYRGLEFQMKDSDISQEFNVLLKEFDTGITSIKLHQISLEDLSGQLPGKVIEQIKEDLDKTSKIFVEARSGKRFTFSLDSKNKDKVNVTQLVTMHKIKGSNKEIEFEILDESDGTQRIIDLLPALREIYSYDKTFVIDEIDRSLHPQIVKRFIDLFYEKSKKSKSQLIFTTHESSLLDLNFLRRDEIWFVEKNGNGESNLYSLEEFKPRYDKDIRKGYLLGRFGAIPFLANKTW